jgi:hypothetical protein
MKQVKQIMVTVIVFVTGFSAFTQQSQTDKYHKYFFEDFRRPDLENFHGYKGGKGADFLLKSGVRLQTERKTILT